MNEHVRFLGGLAAVAASVSLVGLAVRGGVSVAGSPQAQRLLARPDDARPRLPVGQAALQGVEAWSGKPGILAVGFYVEPKAALLDLLPSLVTASAPKGIWVRVAQGYPALPSTWYGWPVHVLPAGTPVGSWMRTLWATFPPAPQSPVRMLVTVEHPDPDVRQRVVQALSVQPGIRPTSRRERRGGVIEVEVDGAPSAVHRATGFLTGLLPVRAVVLDRMVREKREYVNGVRVEGAAS